MTRRALFFLSCSFWPICANYLIYVGSRNYSSNSGIIVILQEEVIEEERVIEKELRKLTRNKIAGYAVPDVIQVTSQTNNNTNLIGPNLTNQRAAIGKNSKHISRISEYCNLIGQDLLAGL